MQEIVFASADISATVLPEAGARLHSLRAFTHEVLRVPTDLARHQDDPFFWGAYVMAPWCGRIDARPTSVAAKTVDVPANFRDGTAIHGQVYARPWQYEGEGEFSVATGGDGWPWPYVVSTHVAVVGRTVRLDQRVLNLSDEPMPAGIGLHPWFRRPVDVQINADLVFDPNSESPPAPRSVDGPWDRRAGGPMPDDLDATWARLGDPAVTLRWPETGVRAEMRTQLRTTYIVAASPSKLDAVAVEPQTHAPQGLRRLLNGEPGAMVLLDGGATLALTTELTFDLDQEEDSR